MTTSSYYRMYRSCGIGESARLLCKVTTMLYFWQPCLGAWKLTFLVRILVILMIKQFWKTLSLGEHGTSCYGGCVCSHPVPSSTVGHCDYYREHCTRILLCRVVTFPRRRISKRTNSSVAHCSVPAKPEWGFFCLFCFHLSF